MDYVDPIVFWKCFYPNAWEQVWKESDQQAFWCPDPGLILQQYIETKGMASVSDRSKF